jgi:hypothetical protein
MGKQRQITIQVMFRRGPVGNEVAVFYEEEQLPLLFLPVLGDELPDSRKTKIGELIIDLLEEIMQSSLTKTGHHGKDV